MNIYGAIENLLDYGVENRLCEKEDVDYIRNLLFDVLKLDTFEEPQKDGDRSLESILKVTLDFAVEKGLVGDNITERDLFDTRIINCLMPPPSVVISKFKEKYKESPKAASDYYYNLSKASNYIRTERVKNDLKWLFPSPYGDLEITINLSKPEKDPRAIAAAKTLKKSGYPKCLLCKENEGYPGRIDYPARENHRVIPLKLGGEDWFMQYSPYVYYNEHCIVINREHVPMKIDRTTFQKLIDFIKILPHYFIGSNAGLPVVGGSILSHEHYQGGRHEFAMAKAPIENKISFKGFEDIDAGIVKWPMSVVRIASGDSDRLVDLADKISNRWKDYSDPEAFIFAQTNGVPHNAVTPIARMRGDKYEFDLVLRNNITTDEYPDGVFHAHPEYHHIKKENIGLIEVMGLAVLPSRLKYEADALKDAILEDRDISGDETLRKHACWADEIKSKYADLNRNNIDEIIKREIGTVYFKILEQCGVFKRTEEGVRQFLRFIEYARKE